jgi:hypothetical protein
MALLAAGCGLEPGLAWCIMISAPLRDGSGNTRTASNRLVDNCSDVADNARAQEIATSVVERRPEYELRFMFTLH